MSTRSAMVSRFCVRPTSKRSFLKIVQVKPPVEASEDESEGNGQKKFLVMAHKT